MTEQHIHLPCYYCNQLYGGSLWTIEHHPETIIIEICTSCMPSLKTYEKKYYEANERKSSKKLIYFPMIIKQFKQSGFKGMNPSPNVMMQNDLVLTTNTIMDMDDVDLAKSALIE